MKFRRLALGVAVLALAQPVTATAVPASWRMVDLGAGDDSVAVAVNDRGHVVGTRGNGAAFLWRHGRITDLGAFTPTDINNRDEVVGYRYDDTGTHAVLWRHGVRIDLGSGGQSNAMAINDRTEVVGWSIDGEEGPMRAFSWRHGRLTSIGADDSIANDVNRRGQIVGGSGGADMVAIRWWFGVETRLSTESTQAVAVNRHGTVAGVRWGPSGTAGFVWRWGRFVELPAPPGGDAEFLQPAGINGRTQVVGTSSAGAFVWERGRTAILPGPPEAVAAGVNECGVIAGASPAADGTRQHAVVWLRGSAEGHRRHCARG